MNEPFELSESEKTTLLQVARKSLESAFSHATTAPAFSNAPDTLKANLPCFVTLMTASNRLRGCIGCLETETSLISNVHEYARRAAFHDPRFNPLEEKELGPLVIGVSVLGPMRPLKSLEEVQIGIHGLHVSHRHFAGVLLAKVAVEQRWNAETFLEETCQKAGLDPKHLAEYQVSVFEEVSFTENRSP